MLLLAGCGNPGTLNGKYSASVSGGEIVIEFLSDGDCAIKFNGYDAYEKMGRYTYTDGKIAVWGWAKKGELYAKGYEWYNFSSEIGKGEFINRTTFRLPAEATDGSIVTCRFVKR